MTFSCTVLKKIYDTMHFLKNKSIVMTIMSCLVIVYFSLVVGLGLLLSTTTIVMFGVALLSTTTTSTTTIGFVVSGISK